MTRNEIERWEQMRANGRNMFILLYGVLYWGVCCGISIGIANTLLRMAFEGDPFNYSRMLSEIALGVVTFLPMGYLWGLAMWAHYEKKYARVTTSRQAIR